MDEFGPTNAQLYGDYYNYSIKKKSKLTIDWTSLLQGSIGGTKEQAWGRFRKLFGILH